jgi:hypothetical protein
MVTRRIVYTLRAHPDTPAALAAKVPTAVAEFIARHEKVRFDRAHLSKYTQDYIEWEVIYTILDADYNLFMDTQQAVILASMQMFADLGISTAPRAQQLLLQDAGRTGNARRAARPRAPPRHPAQPAQRGLRSGGLRFLLP